MRAKLLVVVTVALLVAWARLAGSGALVSISDAQVDTSNTSIQLTVTPKDKELDAEWELIGISDFLFMSIQVAREFEEDWDIGNLPARILLKKTRLHHRFHTYEKIRRRLQMWI